MSVSTVMLNFFASRCPEGDEIIAGFGVANRINTVVVMLLIGLGQGIQPLVGYGFSSGNYQRVNSVIRWSVIFSVSLGTVLMLCFLYFPETIVRAFIDNEAVVGYGVGLLKAPACVAPIFGIQFIFLNTFQAMGKVFPSSVISVSRQGVFFYSCAADRIPSRGSYRTYVGAARCRRRLCDTLVDLVFYNGHEGTERIKNIKPVDICPV